jgi:hypothetical protein
MNRSYVYLVTAGLLLFRSLVHGENCTSGKGFSYNFIYSVSGSKDSLSLYSSDKNTYAVNFIAGKDSLVTRAAENSNWMNTVLGCKDERILGIAYGAEKTVICFDTGSTEALKHGSVSYVNHATGKLTDLPFAFGEKLTKQNGVKLLVSNAAYHGGSFYFACNDGQIVTWNPVSNTMRILVPGNSQDTSLSKFTGTKQVITKRDATTFDTSYVIDTLKRVSNISVSGSYLAITTPNAIYTYNPDSSQWKEYDTTSADPSKSTKITSFVAAYVNSLEPSLPVYAVAKVRKGANQKDTVALCKYSENDRGWKVVLGDDINGLAFGANSFIYVINSKNEILTLKDTLGSRDTMFLPVYSYSNQISPRMTRDYGISDPENINDIIYLPLSDTSGNLWIATSEGLFLSAKEVPGKSTHNFSLIKRAPVVKGALKQVYARPGILQSDEYSKGQCVFVYNLSKNANVTIRVYDFNMDLVKTIIEKRPRIAGNNGGPLGRSTVEKEDFWDGRNRSGKMVAPGVYYFKITTDSGELAFGKIIMAK